MPGSIVEISIDGRSFKAASDADGSTKYGGIENEFQANGDGETGRLIQTRVGWSLTGVSIAIDDENDDLEYCEEIKRSGRFVPIKAVYADGTVRSGRGNITGELTVSSMSGTADMSFEGAGVFAKQ